MKTALCLIVLSTMGALRAEASVCILAVPSMVGANATLNCDGKSENEFVVGDTYLADESRALDLLVKRGYRIVGESTDGSGLWTLVK